jgi:hypothetical protein
MDAVVLGKAGLRGWRAKVGDVAAEPAARHAPLSLIYVTGTLRRMLGRQRP